MYKLQPNCFTLTDGNIKAGANFKTNIKSTKQLLQNLQQLAVLCNYLSPKATQGIKNTCSTQTKPKASFFD